MIKNYLKIAFRNLRKYRFTSFINIFGLTVGLTCCLLILAYVLTETNYDRYNPKAGQIYRVTRSFYNQDGAENLHLSAVAPPFGPLLQHAFPDIQKMTRVLSNGNTVLHYKDKIFNEKQAFFADEHFFDFFPVPVVKGNAQTGLTGPQSIMLSEAMAAKYFGNEDPIDKLIKVDNQLVCKVTGVFKAMPHNAHMHADMLISFNTLNDTAIYGKKQLETNFGNNAFYTYLMFPEHYSAEKVEAQFPAFLDRDVHFPGAPATYKTSAGTRLFLQKLTDIHLRSHLDDEIEENGDIKRVYIFSAIALFILLIACINYMNLATARSILRAREIGVRKVVGAQRKEIIMQFLSESVLLTWFALILAFAATSILLNYINTLTDLQLSVTNLLQWQVILPLVLLPFVVGIVSGIYPALFMSSFKPVKVLKGIVKFKNSSFSFRQVLVVFQFAISIVLIVATTIVFQQLNYMQNSSLGFNRDHLITLPYASGLDNKFETFRNDILQNPSIKNIGRSSRIPTGRLLDDQGASVLSGDSLIPIKADLKYITADHDFIPAYNIEMAAGRNFSKQYATDTAGFIINEAAVQMFGWKTPQNAIGKSMAYGSVKGKIIGVTRDFHFESMHQKIVPLLMALASPNIGGYGNLSIKVSGQNIQASISDIEKKWNKYLPEIPFRYTFLDERFAALYKSETQQGNLFTIFSFVAIFIACLGLFGLSAFIITQRIKEIGIRKILGANMAELVRVLSADFLKLVVVAAVIAIPAAAFAMHAWLQDFAYRITMAWWVFAMAAILALLIAFITISFQAVKAALVNPVKSLRTE